MKKYKVKDIMIRNPGFIKPETGLSDAARIMKKENCGVLPVGTKEKLEGIITDRDLVIRALINVDHHEQPVKDYMTSEVFCCKEDDTLEQAADNMQDHKVCRLMVKDMSGQYTGLLSFGDILRHKAKGKDVAKVVQSCLCDEIN